MESRRRGRAGGGVGGGKTSRLMLCWRTPDVVLAQIMAADNEGITVQWAAVQGAESYSVQMRSDAGPCERVWCVGPSAA